jgi:putative aldouronate transport system permease protein
MKLTRGEQLFSAANYTFLGLFALLALAPFVHILAQSFSSYRAIMSGEVAFWPVDFTLEPYSKVLGDQSFRGAFLVSVLRTGAGTFLNLLLTCLLAYPLSKVYIKGRRIISFLIVFTMLFSGGMIPTYLVVKETGLLNTFWAFLLPGAISAFNVIIMKNFFLSVPGELEESARIDGCSNIGILLRIFIPLSMPAIATIGLFHAVAHWNAFFDAVLYITDSKLNPLQVYLRNLIQSNSSTINTTDQMERQMLAMESLKAAALITATVPILIIYPFMQKHFVKGIYIGSVKG